MSVQRDDELVGGDLVVLAGPDGGGVQCVLLAGPDGGGVQCVLLEQPNPGGFASALLCHEHPGSACESDVILTPQVTGLSFLLVAQTDVIGPVDTRRVISCPGRVTQQALRALRDPSLARQSGLSKGRVLQGPRDPRWGWKVAQVGRLHDVLAPVWLVCDEAPAVPCE